MHQAFSDTTVRGQFAGHETFPLRLLWLKKAVNAIEEQPLSRTFQEPAAIARFGVGKNMALSMRFWALAAGFAVESGTRLEVSALGRLIAGTAGLDPYMERAATAWLAHWAIASTPAYTTTTYVAFNAFSAPDFEPSALLSALTHLVSERGWRASDTTLKRDVEVFLRSYARRRSSDMEDAAEPLLAELNLIREVRPGWFEFVRGPKSTLPDGIFAYALAQFWASAGKGAKVITAEQVSFMPGSPGRVFKLDEDTVVTRLMAMEALTGGAWRFTDTAGLRQIQQSADVDPLELVRAAYPPVIVKAKAA